MNRILFLVLALIAVAVGTSFVMRGNKQIAEAPASASPLNGLTSATASETTSVTAKIVPAAVAAPAPISTLPDGDELPSGAAQPAEPMAEQITSESKEP